MFRSSTAKPLDYLLFLVIVAGATTANAIDCLDYTEPLYGPPIVLPDGDPRALTPSGEHLYIVMREQQQLVCLDISQPDIPEVLVVQDLPSPAYGVAAHGDLLLVSLLDPLGLALFSLVDPGAPEYLVTIDGVGGRSGAVVVGDRLYALGDDELRIYDITAPNQPAMTNTVFDGEYQSSISLIGDHLYVGRPGRTLVCELSEPDAPAVVTELAFSNPKYMLQHGSQLYLVAHGSLGAADVSDPATPMMLCTVDAASNPDALARIENRLLYFNNGEVDVYDITDPTQIQFLWEDPRGYSATDAKEHHGRIYQVSGNLESGAYLRIIDSALAVFPYEGVTDLPWFSEDLMVRDGVGYIAAGYGLTVVDCSDPAALEVLAQVQTSESWWYRDIVVDGPYAVIWGSQYDPVYVFDVSVPNQPVVTDEFTGLTGVNAMALHGRHLFTASMSGDFTVHEIVDGELQYRDTVSAGNSTAYGVQLQDNRLLATTIGILYVFDISDPNNLVYVGHVDLEGAHTLALHQPWAFTSGVELTIWDLSDALAPIRVGACPANGRVAVVHGPQAYLVGGGADVEIVDLEDPGHPAVLGRITTDGWAVDADVLADRLLIQTRHGGGYAWAAWLQCPPAVSTIIDFFDVEATLAGMRIGWKLPGGSPGTMVLERESHHGRVAVAFQDLGQGLFEAIDPWVTGEDGWRTYTLSVDGMVLASRSAAVQPPSSDLRLSVAPNPFNPATTLTFTLSGSSRVDLDIYDATGRRVRQLMHERPLAAGRQSMTWDGRDNGGRELPSGTYLARIRTEAEQRTCKLSLLR